MPAGKQSRDQKKSRSDTRNEAETSGVKPTEFRAINVNKREPQLAGGERSFIVSAQRTSECSW